MTKCSTCGSEDTEMWYNRRIQEHYIGIREKIIICNCCKTTEVKREVI